MSHEEAINFRLQANEQAIKEQWVALNEIKETLSEIKQMLAKLETTIEKIDDHEKRIKALETWRTLLIGGWGVVSLIAYLAWEYFLKSVGKH